MSENGAEEIFTDLLKIHGTTGSLSYENINILPYDIQHNWSFSGVVFSK